MIIILETSYSQSVCDVGGLCYENDFGCYFGKNEIIGYKSYLFNKDCTGNDLGYKIFSVDECAKWCIEHNNCVAILTKNNYCWIKGQCSNYIDHEGFQMYMRIADDRFSCFYGGLNNLPALYHKGAGPREQQKTNAAKNNEAIVITPFGLKIKVNFIFNDLFLKNSILTFNFRQQQ